MLLLVLLLGTEIAKSSAEILIRHALGVESKPVMLRTNELGLPGRKCFFGCAELPLGSWNRCCCRRHLRGPWRSRIKTSQHSRPVLDPQFNECITHPLGVSDLSTGIEQLLIPARRVHEHVPTLPKQVLRERQGSGIRDRSCGRDGYTGIDDRTLQHVGVDDRQACGPRDRSRKSGLARAGHSRKLYEHRLNLTRASSSTNVVDSRRCDARSCVRRRRPARYS